LKSRDLMEEHENLYEKIQEILGGSTGNLKILEQQIELDLQMEYFDCSTRIREERDEQWAFEHIQYLSSPSCSTSLKKEILARLATIEKVECYRILEHYLQEASESVRPWVLLALNESRMLLESKILDENLVYISTGLGGKDEKLRYFAVLISRTHVELAPSQQKVIRNEFEYILKKFNAEVEESCFSGYLATMMVLLPMTHSLKSVFKEAIDECNKYGNFLNDDIIVTNVRVLSFEEIKDFLERRGKQG
jgi:hypothetical protein